MTSESQQSPAAEQHARETVQQLFGFIIAQGDADYIGEPISQLEHSLQAAQLARDSGADDETVLGALLHDVGRFIPAADKMPKMIATDGTYVGRASHEVVGERYLRQLGFGEKVCQLVAAHVMAKRYLTAVDKEYYDGLSNASKNTLRMQVGHCFHVSWCLHPDNDNRTGRHFRRRPSQKSPRRSLVRGKASGTTMGRPGEGSRHEDRTPFSLRRPGCTVPS